MYFKVKWDVRRGKKRGMIRKLYFIYFKCEVLMDIYLEQFNSEMYRWDLGRSEDQSLQRGDGLNCGGRICFFRSQYIFLKFFYSFEIFELDVGLIKIVKIEKVNRIRLVVYIGYVKGKVSFCYFVQLVFFLFIILNVLFVLGRFFVLIR